MTPAYIRPHQPGHRQMLDPSTLSAIRRNSANDGWPIVRVAAIQKGQP
jgi:hypothetical protein